MCVGVCVEPGKVREVPSKSVVRCFLFFAIGYITTDVAEGVIGLALPSVSVSAP